LSPGHFAVNNSADITREPDGALAISGASLLATIAADALVRRDFPLLASACEQSGDAAARASMSLAGSLIQPPHCSYLRRGVPCLKNGGQGCPAHDGENHELAILDGGPCWVVHPSDAGVALVALEADVDVAENGEVRTIPAADFFILPSVRLDRETVLRDGEHIVRVRVPAAAAGGLQRYTRLAEPQGDGVPLVSLAMARRVDGDARLVLGGVSPRPYRVYTSVEEEAVSGGLDEETIAGLAERALLDAAPLSKNGFKVGLAESLLRDAIREIDAAS
jgi:xanthine dehydrogenase YagS FAD-binding subunit